VTPPLQERVLEALESARNYNAWVASLVCPHMGDDAIEVGSGTGTYAALWLDAGLPRLTVSDTEPAMVERLSARFAGDPRVSVRELDLLDAPEAQHSSVVALNVLEHIADDVAGLRAAARLVHPGGAVVMFVPAFRFAMSRFDRAIGHYRRYTADTLRAAFVDAGLEVEEVTYVNAPGLLAWTVGMRLLRMTPSEGIVLRSWDRLVVPAARRLEARRPPRFGQSVLGVGRSVA
jgi:SAM-dependent methyltransferase